MENKLINGLISPAELQTKIENGYTVDISALFNEGFSLFKMDAGKYIGYAFLSFFLIILSAITIVGPIFIAYPLMLGFSIGALEADKGQPFTLKDMLNGFAKFVPLLIFTFISLAISSIIFIPTNLLGFQEAFTEVSTKQLVSETYWLSLGVVSIIGLCINAFLFLAPYLIYFGDFDPLSAVKTSFQLTKKKIFHIILYVLLLSLLMYLGIIFFIVGFFVTYALGMVCYYPLVKEILFASEVKGV